MKKNRAFTLPELIVVFTLIGIISVVSLYTINNRFTDFFSRYFTAFDALHKAVYNTYTDTYCRTDVTGTTDCSSEYINKGRPFPTNAASLCARLKEYLNAAEGVGNCSNNVIGIPNDNQFTNNNLQFMLTNGFKFYLSNKNDNVKTAQGEKIEYFIAYVDLNGSAKPNSYGLPHPDIVPFVITTTGEVIPIGYPIYDKTYATARVMNYENEQTTSYTINEASQKAYGQTPYKDIPFSLIRLFERKNVTKRPVLPEGVPNKVNILKEYQLSDNKIVDFDCEEGTYNCVMKIDENLERRH